MGGGLRDKLITCTGGLLGVVFVIVCDLETVAMRRPRHEVGCRATGRHLWKNVAMFKYLGTPLKLRRCLHEEAMSILCECLSPFSPRTFVFPVGVCE